MIQTVVVSYLLADEELSEIVGTRIYPLRLPQRETLPAVVYQVITNAPINTLDGDRGVDNVSLQLSCWAQTYAQAQALAAEVRRVIGGIDILRPTIESLFDGEDQETKSYRVILNFALWDGMPSPNSFQYVTSNGGIDPLGVSLPFPVVTNGYYLVFKNGAVMKEGEDAGFYFNEARDHITFVEALGTGDDLDEILVIFQAADGPEFSRIEFNGAEDPNGFDVDPPLIEDGYHAVTLNGTFSKEGDRYQIDPALDHIDFLTALEVDDEGILVYQSSVTPTFEIVNFNGDDNPSEVDLPSAIVEGGLYHIIINGRIAKEGISGRFTLNDARDKVLFNQPLEGGDDKDEGFVIYQSS